MSSRILTSRCFAWITYSTSALPEYVARGGLTAYPPSNHSALQDVEYEYDFSPAWRYVATHMHWTERLETIGELYLRSTFGLEADQPIPPVSSRWVYFINGSTLLINM